MRWAGQHRMLLEAPSLATLRRRSQTLAHILKCMCFLESSRGGLVAAVILWFHSLTFFQCTLALVHLIKARYTLKPPFLLYESTVIASHHQSTGLQDLGQGHPPSVISIRNASALNSEESPQSTHSHKASLLYVCWF